MKTLLVVDSDSVSRRLLVSGLADLEDECEVLEAGNGVEAMRILSSRPVDLVATELDMPAMDGFELAAYILEHHPSVEIVVLGNPDSGRVGQALTAEGAFRYLPKADAAELLTEVVRDLSPAATRGPIEGLSLAGFLQLLNSENRSCSLRVEAKRGRGWVDLIDGEVFDATSGKLRGRRALYALLALEDPLLKAEGPRSGVDRTINSGLPRLLLEAAFWQDEFTTGASHEPETLGAGAEVVEVVSETASHEEGKSSPVAELLEIKRALLALLGLDGAIGAAVVDMERSACFLHVSLDSHFPEIAVRAGEIAKQRFEALADAPEVLVLQITQPSVDGFGLVRRVASKPNLMLYFAGEMDYAEPVEAGALLADLERLLAAHFDATPAP